MDLSNSDLLFIKNNLNKVPIVVLAKKFNMPLWDFCKMLRTSGISTIIKDIELQYMRDCEDMGIPPKKVKETLGLTSTQFSQICSRHGFKQLRGLKDILLEDAIKNTRWLVEEELKMKVDDYLPKYLKQENFVNNGLSDCLRFANYEKKKDSYFKHFSAVAFLVCKTYPENFRPFQFPHAKTNNYFKGNEGRKNYLQELAWLIETKMDPLKLKDINTYVSNNTFLRTKDLDFFRLGYHTYKDIFNGVNDIKNELIKMYGNVTQKPNEKSDKLVQKLIDANFPTICSVENCYNENPKVHHIIPKRNKKGIEKFKIEDFDHVDNLVFLCPNHHDIADQEDWKKFLKLKGAKRREMLLKILNETDKKINEKLKEDVLNK
jgi:hypothetical protein